MDQSEPQDIIKQINDVYQRFARKVNVKGKKKRLEKMILKELN
jgi:hypothetical protein